MPASYHPDLMRCRALLPSVSRTFALTIKVLPSSLRDPVTVAYLLCRMADELEDGTTVSPAARVEGLEELARSLGDPAFTPEDAVTQLAAAAALPFDDPAGKRLFEEREVLFRALSILPEGERVILRRWIQAMALGMASFVGREVRGRTDEGRSVPYVLETRDDLRLYAYYVAGTVGHLLNDLFAETLGSKLAPSRERLRELAVPFGLGLQFTNILQDLADDRKRGWSYVPEDVARAHGTTAETLILPGQRAAALRVVGDLVQEAAGYLDRALEFTLLLPRSAPRVRLFCLWPIFFALRTLARIWGEERVLLGGNKVRITRQEVRSLIGMTSAACLSDRGVQFLYRSERSRLERRMSAVAL